MSDPLNRLSRFGPDYLRKAIEAREKLPRCIAIRRDGAPCQNPAMTGYNHCHAHNKGVRSKRYGPKSKTHKGYELRKARGAEFAAMKEAAKTAPAELRQRDSWKEISAMRDTKRQGALCLEYNKLVSGEITAGRFAEFETRLLDGLRQAIKRQDKAMKRRYAEREALGVPHPEDKSKW